MILPLVLLAKSILLLFVKPNPLFIRRIIINKLSYTLNNLDFYVGVISIIMTRICRGNACIFFRVFFTKLGHGLRYSLEHFSEFLMIIHFTCWLIILLA